MIQFRLLNNARGVLLSRQPITVSSDLKLAFEGAPVTATVVFSNEEREYYRALNGVSCVIPYEALKGVIKIVVAVMDGKIGSPRFECEALFAKRLSDGSVLITANDGELPGQVATLLIENHELREKNVELEARIDKLDKAFEKLFEGYDIL